VNIIHFVVDLNKFLSRLQGTRLSQVLPEFPVVVLVGARQTGKTTLVQSPEIGSSRRYTSLDDLADLDLAVRDPPALLMGAERITIDEIQRAPNLLSAIKREVDRERTPGRFLCTGSANLLLMRRVSESLAGRAVYLELLPFTWSELEKRQLGPALDAAVAAESPADLLARLAGTQKHRVRHPLDEAVFRGGFPVAALTENAATRSRWFEGYVGTYIERDLRLLSAIEDLVSFRRFMQAAALRNSSMLNIAQLAQDAGIPPSTAARYLSLMEVSFLVWKLPAFTVNRGKRLAKSPRLLWVDSGLAAHLAGYREKPELMESRFWGAWLEAWVGHQLRAWAAGRDPRPELSTWRTSAGHEVDFIIEAGRRILPVEVKATPRPMGGDLRGLESFLDLHPEARFGVLACACTETHAVSSRIIAVPFETLLLG
jgi:predicted AAA+ superfamily ATPase